MIHVLEDLWKAAWSFSTRVRRWGLPGAEAVLKLRERIHHAKYSDIYVPAA